uniref:Uncharacterized protein n=1 Tax=Anguilla anguilla TaxID=7936 RepID=A0A0E9X1M0_ANGAN
MQDISMILTKKIIKKHHKEFKFQRSFHVLLNALTFGTNVMISSHILRFINLRFCLLT